MIRKMTLPLCLLLFAIQLPAWGQYNCDDDVEIKKFLKKVEGFPEDMSTGSLYAVELLKNGTILNAKWAIFKIGMHASHVNAHFLLVKNGVRQYVNTYTDTIKILQTIFEYLDTTPFTDDKKLAYIRAVVDTLDLNSIMNPLLL